MPQHMNEEHPLSGDGDWGLGLFLFSTFILHQTILNVMEVNMSQAEVSSSHLDVPYAQRWEILKPILSRLYIDEKKGVKEIVNIMQAEYRFYASQTQYKRQFGIWNLAKALPSKKKEKIAKVLQTRAQQSKNTAVKYNGHDQSTAMRRYLKEQKRQNVALLPKVSLSIENLTGHALQCGNHLFMNWNMSPAVLAFLRSNATDALSPGLQYGTPMSGVEMHTPASNPAPSPAQQTGPPSQKNNVLSNEQSSMMLVARETLLISRTHTFLTGDHMALLGGMNSQEQMITTDWLHQFWQFSFRTARTWGRGPRTWNAESLDFKRLAVANIHNSSNSAAVNAGSPNVHLEGPTYWHRSSPNGGMKKPDSECRWSIHVRTIHYEKLASPPPDLNSSFEMGNEETWKPWAEHGSIHNFAEKLEQNIESNSFSDVNMEELPLAANQITRGLKRDTRTVACGSFWVQHYGSQHVLGE
ncbi:hypothetical protein VTL71DRAFT_10290 [Oculimacula yallundae]|uniref:Clr5 domain-containing protein n=1 Tax=Oculimacula yallundae TaxID=86028 RepID=A0ABR4CU61_9HELO